MAAKRVEYQQPFVRFLRWAGKPLKDESINVAAGREYKFVVSAGGSSIAPLGAVCVRISDGVATTPALDIRKLGTGQLWIGTIPAKMLSAGAEYLLRVGTRTEAFCEIELKVKGRSKS